MASHHSSSHSATLSPTNTMAAPAGDAFPAQLLSSSISSLSSSTSSRRGSPVTKIYHQSSTLFLTRRLPEALTTLQPLITQHGRQGGVVEPAPVARASRNTRIKVWSLYLTILNAIVELEPEEGKDAFGAQEWRGICAKVRDGQVWEDVVQNGYHGAEGDVDSEVVINLATLLLAHARDQTLNQKRLESFLATCNTPNLDLSHRLNNGADALLSNGHQNRYMSPARGAVSGGADTPRDLNARVKILELYTLHVLLRNNEWDYAREFISVSSVLDDERREAFLQALQSLQEEQQEAEKREREERERQQEEMRRNIEEARRLRAENERLEQKRRAQEEKERRQGSSEVDYGIEDAPIAGAATASVPAKTARNGNRRSAMSRTGKKAPPPGPLTLKDRMDMVVRRCQAVIDQLSISLQVHPVVLMRLMAFILGLLLMLSSKAIRERVRRILGGSWAKVKATAGMGAKVSYI